MSGTIHKKAAGTVCSQRSVRRHSETIARGRGGINIKLKMFPGTGSQYAAFVKGHFKYSRLTSGMAKHGARLDSLF
jgi:hypothetical protein